MALSISVWSDIACPWCFVGKRRLEAAIELYLEQAGTTAEQIEVTWRSFELDPRPKNSSDQTPYVQRLANKYGTSVAQAQSMIDNMTRTGSEEGIAFDFSRAIPANTFNAHRLLQWALQSDYAKQTHGGQIRLKEAFVRAHLEQGVDLGDESALLSIVNAAGLDAEQAAGVLASDEFCSEVRADEEEAKLHGISGVPFFVIGRFGVAGAQKPDTLLEVIQRAVDEERQTQAELLATESAEGAVCTTDGC